MVAPNSPPNQKASNNNSSLESFISDSENSLLEMALSLTRKGFPVVPISKSTLEPLTKAQTLNDKQLIKLLKKRSWEDTLLALDLGEHSGGTFIAIHIKDALLEDLKGLLGRIRDKFENTLTLYRENGAIKIFHLIAEPQPLLTYQNDFYKNQGHIVLYEEDIQEDLNIEAINEFELYAILSTYAKLIGKPIEDIPLPKPPEIYVFYSPEHIEVIFGPREKKGQIAIDLIYQIALHFGNYVYLDECLLPRAFVKVKKIKEGRKEVERITYETGEFKMLLDEIGALETPLDPEKAIKKLMEYGNLTERDLEEIRIRRALDFITPVGIRIPFCIQHIISVVIGGGILTEKEEELLALWIKYYAKRPEGTLETFKLAIDPKLQQIVKILSIFGYPNIPRFMEIYKGAKDFWPCVGKGSCPMFMNASCPFIAPKRKEFVLTNILDIELHGNDAVVVSVLAKNGEIKKFVKTDNLKWETGTKTKKYPIAEWILDNIAREALMTPEIMIDPYVLTEYLKARARVVKSQFKPEEEIVSQFIEFLQTLNKKGVMKYEEASDTKLFIRENFIGVPINLVKEFCQIELNLTTNKLSKILAQELGPNFRKETVWLFKKSSNKKSATRVYLISLEWFKDKIGEPNIIEESNEDLTEEGFSFEEGEANED